MDDIEEAMESWEGVCGVRFEMVTPRSSAYEIKHVSQNVWFSTIGENNSQCYMLFDGSYHVDTIIHELGHCIGLAHEHQRPDRDKYVYIYWENILPVKQYNFEIIENPLIEEEEFKYDYHSIMHYSPTSFSVNGNITIEAIDGSSIYRTGGITKIDAAKARSIYGHPLD